VNLEDIRKNYDVLVIPCSSVKLTYPEIAEKFYCGKGYFLHQLRIAKASKLPFYIFSSKYGLISPSAICEPYDLIWSKQVQNDNKSMRGRMIPIASEELRVAHSIHALTVLNGKRVLTFCSMHYRSYLPAWTFFNEVIGKNRPSNSRGIQFIVQTLNQIYLEALNGES
jgi:hypothetical protein